jgi:acyl phosphate:glycerol-3-phosphate acyltransferase
MILEILFALMAYLLGSIPNAIWIGRRFYGVDVREHGSGNAGATNVFRVLGKVPGSIVLILDVLKGYMAVRLVDVMNWLWPRLKGVNVLGWEGLHDSDYVMFSVLFGALAVVGHLLPVFAKFQGGKGVATLFGMIIALNPAVAGLALLVFVVVNIISGYVSLGSLMAGLSIPVLFIHVFGQYDVSIQVFSIAVAVLIVFTHRKNIKRLMSGEETKSRILVKKSK